MLEHDEISKEFTSKNNLDNSPSRLYYLLTEGEQGHKSPYGSWSRE